MSKLSNRHYSEREFQEHLKIEHATSPISLYLREIVYGGSDGIVTTFAVVAGFAGASGGEDFSTTMPVLAVLLFGLANLFADGSSMALGNFLSLRADKDLYGSHESKERHEVKNNPYMEWTETVHILKQKGFSIDDAKKMADIYQKNEKAWVEFMMTYELEMPNPENDNPILASLATFTAFIIFGFVPLLPYMLFNGDVHHFQLSIIFTILALLLLGLLRWRVTGILLKRSVFEIVSLSGTSAIIAFIVGSFFRL